MKTIYKYEIKNPESTITLPCGYDILCAKVQVSGMFEELFLWALVNPDEEKQEDVRIRVFATGDDIDNPQELVYIDTVMMRNGALVFHVFRVESGRENPLSWHDTKKELPEIDVELQVMPYADSNAYDVMRYDRYGWWQQAPGGGWCAATNAPARWRYIHTSMGYEAKARTE